MGALASVVVSGLAGCDWPAYEGPPSHPYPPYYYGYYDYYYYPYSEVYFHVYSGWYYYRDHGRWLRVRHLPPHIHLDQRHRHRLIIRDKTPWQRHEEHRRQYPPTTGYRREYGPAERATPRPRGGFEPERRPSPGIRRGGDRDRGLGYAPSGGTSHAAPPRRTETPRRTERRVSPAEPRRSVSPAGPRASPPREQRREWERDRGERNRDIGRQRNVPQRHERSNKEWWPHGD